MLEFGCSPDGTMTGLTILLACSHDRGGGDLHQAEGERGKLLMEHIAGRWAGDRIAIIGDYSEDGDFPGFVMADSPWEGRDPETGASETWLDISELTIECMEMDSYVKEERGRRGDWPSSSPPMAELTSEGVRPIQGVTS